MCQPPPVYTTQWEKTIKITTTKRLLQNCVNSLGTIANEDEFPQSYREIVPDGDTVNQSTQYPKWEWRDNQAEAEAGVDN